MAEAEDLDHAPSVEDEDGDVEPEDEKPGKRGPARYGLPVWTLGFHELSTVNLYKSLMAEFFASTMFIWYATPPTHAL